MALVAIQRAVNFQSHKIFNQLLVKMVFRPREIYSRLDIIDQIKTKTETGNTINYQMRVHDTGYIYTICNCYIACYYSCIHIPNMNSECNVTRLFTSKRATNSIGLERVITLSLN